MVWRLRLKITTKPFTMNEESKISQNAFVMIERIDHMLQKVMFRNLEDNDLPELTELLDNKRCGP